MEDLPDLPVVPVLGEVEAALADEGSAVLVAPPGAGKTTLVPLALLESDWLGDGTIVMLEPRRLAARSAARYMASLLGERDAGGTVGYRVRMDTRVGSETRVEVVTEGVLTRMLLDDPSLSSVAVVIFDEFHERSLNADLGLALALQARELLRPDLRILVMSATLDAAPVARLLDGDGGGAPVIRSEGRSWPVETRWRDRPVEGWIEPPTAATVLDALEEDEGDVLVFLPGAGEIRRTAERLEEAGLPGNVDLHPLFGSLSRGDQDRAIAPSPAGRRKVVLATSIAETSLTIEGVRVVVDSGRMRIPRFDPGSGMTRLATVRVTRDSADQRRGRAGRTAPGVCYRLWTRSEDRGLVPAHRPEMEEADLTPLALDLAVWGARPEELRWLTPPPEAALAQAHELLVELEAVDEEGAVTDHGRAMADFGLHPRIAHMMLRGRELGMGGLACDLAALLGDRDVLDAPGRAPEADLRLRVEVLQRDRRGKGTPAAGVRGHRVRRGRLRSAQREARHLRRRLGARADDGREDGHGGGHPGDPTFVGLLLAFAYPDRVGRRREGSRGRFLLRNGRGARFFEEQAIGGSEWIVAAELDARGRDARIFRAAPVEEAEIEEHFTGQIRVEEDVRWDAEAGRVVARRRELLGAIPLREGPLEDPSRDALLHALLEGIRSEGIESLPWSRETRSLRERLQFLHGLEPERWPDRSEEALLDGLEEWLVPFLGGGPPPKRLEELRRVDVREALLTGVDWSDRDRLDELAPTHLEVPSGSRIPIDYTDPEVPTLAVRLQEVFGMTETPRLGGGRVSLTIKLLSPAQRPVQITRDLKSFWRDTYFEVRKDLRGRYPKHPWPEDPLTAQATNRTKRNR